MYNEINGGDPGLDPITDAHTTPGTFSPQCGLSGHDRPARRRVSERARLVQRHRSRDGADAQIYQLVPANLQQPPPNGISCADNDFCPLATRMTNQAPQHSWAMPLPDFAANIRTRPELDGRSGRLRPDRQPEQRIRLHRDEVLAGRHQRPLARAAPTNGQPWITTLIYQSTTDPNGYYIAFEDQPMCTASWRGCTRGDANQA